MKKAIIIIVAVVMALGSMGVSYAGLFSGGTPINTNCVPNQNCDVHCKWVISNDNGTVENPQLDAGDDGGPLPASHDQNGPLSSADPKTPGANCLRYDKDVAKTTGWCEDGNITILIENAYPSYYPTVFFGLKNYGTMLATITGITPVNPYPNELTFSYNGISVGQQIPINGEVTGNVQIHVEQSAQQKSTYKVSLRIDFECTPSISCETAYARAYPKQHCFTQYGFSDWGWTNGQLSLGYEDTKVPIYAGAAQCDITKGTLVGYATIKYYKVNSTCKVDVQFKMNNGYTMKTTHVYVGTTPVPIKYNQATVAPGQYPYQHSLNNATTDSYTITLNSGMCGKNVYVIAHADVCWPH